MYVVATAGHVDHGKSTLLRALTGMEPDRWAEERDRGMTIDLGYVWGTLPSGAPIAFVDVPGHERFLSNMLAGVGPVPAVLFVVAADEGWMPQSAEHLAALDALGVRHGLLAITRADLCDPDLALAEARGYLRGTSLAGIDAVAVSAVTGAGLGDLWCALGRAVRATPPGDPRAPVRLWIDRAFAMHGSGTVITGTLGAGTISVGDELQWSPDGFVRVRGLQMLKTRVDTVTGTARVAVNLRGADRAKLRRGVALSTPGAWRFTTSVDAWLDQPPATDPAASPRRLPVALTLHVGSARVPVRLRILGEPHPADHLVVRLSLASPLPLHVGDTAVLRDANRARGDRIVGRVTALDVCPLALIRRGAAANRGRLLGALPAPPDGRELLAQRGVLRHAELIAMGRTAPAAPLVGDWLVDPGHAESLRVCLREVVLRHATEHPLEPGMPLDAARQVLGLPDRRLVEALLTEPLRLAGGRVHHERAVPTLPPAIAGAVDRLRDELSSRPFQAPAQERLAELGLDRRAVAAAARHGALMRVSDDIVLLPDADQEAVRILRGLPQPFTASDARQALATTRRVVIPLLEYLDRRGVTERVDATRRKVRS
jgi:selenocysteine-specific elongation factor